MTQNWRDLPFSKGFVLAKRDLGDLAHFTKKHLPGGWVLWRDDAVETDISTTPNDNFVVIRGHWIDTADDAVSGATAKQLLDAFNREGSLGLHRRIARIGGRYVIIIKHDSDLWVYNDATGLRSVYYTLDESIVASHLNLLTLLDPHTPSFSAKDTMRAMDLTPYPSVRQLLPNFRLNLATATTERFFPFEPNRFLSMSSEERLVQVEKIWQRVSTYYLQRAENLTISITGGLDSKLMLAMCGRFSTEFHAYTYGVTNASDKRAESLEFDITQVKSMLPALKLKSHQFLDITTRAQVSEPLKSVVASNTWGHHGPYLVPLYREIFPGDGWFHLRGSGVEIIRRYWPVTDTSLSSLLRPLRTPGGPPIENRAKALGYDQPQHGYHLMDLVYWEIRMGKWHAEILNEQDAAFETFLPISVREIYELLLAFNETERENALAVWELINRNNPILNFWGANDPRNIYEQWRDERELQPADQLPKDEATSDSSADEDSKSVMINLSKEQFLQGNSHSIEVCKTPTDGALSLTIDQPYRKPSGAGYFEWQVRLNNEILIKCDGALTTTPTTVTFWNLPKESKVVVALLAHRNGPRESDSWERASRTAVGPVKFFPGNIDGDERLKIGCDNPYAEISDTPSKYSPTWLPN